MWTRQNQFGQPFLNKVETHAAFKVWRPPEDMLEQVEISTGSSVYRKSKYKQRLVSATVRWNGCYVKVLALLFRVFILFIVDYCMTDNVRIFGNFEEYWGYSSKFLTYKFKDIHLYILIRWKNMYRMAGKGIVTRKERVESIQILVCI